MSVCVCVCRHENVPVNNYKWAITIRTNTNQTLDHHPYTENSTDNAINNVLLLRHTRISHIQEHIHYPIMKMY